MAESHRSDKLDALSKRQVYFLNLLYWPSTTVLCVLFWVGLVHGVRVLIGQ
jgi:hypothetical protein